MTILAMPRNTRSSRSSSLEMWGGVECTVNRVQDEYFDQLARTDHCARPSDLEHFANLGISAIRLPILWEHVQGRNDQSLQWEWPDYAMSWLRDHAIHPILGLTHHGSGPPWTNLLDFHFPEQFAKYARQVAERYPWATAYTPINEPLTTARFSGLYGHWYPHTTDTAAFLRMLLNQCRAIALAMHEIRQVNPDARLVQTEDLGKVSSTPALTYQRDFENERRWLTWDLLCGRVTSDHPLWSYIIKMGESSGIEDDLRFFLDYPCPPDIIGINHYLTSERFLDDDVSRYPTHMHGGNGIHSYVDLETVRASTVSPVGLGTILRDAWHRYQLPLAITECHLGCTREEQMRWLFEVWETGNWLRDTGVDIRAVTAWALLGSFDWDSLVTRKTGYYEPGAFDARSSPPRPTTLARMVRSLATTGSYYHPVLNYAGWWRKHARLDHTRPEDGQSNDQPLLITGATGTLGNAFARICKDRGIPYYLSSREDMDITDSEAVLTTFKRHRPWAIINAAGYVDVDRAETEQSRCYRENIHGPVVLAGACKRYGVQLLTFSTDLVFDGEKQDPYVEHDTVAPLSTYGLSKVIAESLTLQTMPTALVIRTSAFFDPWDERNLVTRALRTLQEGMRLSVANDVVITPTYIPDLVHTALDLLLDEESDLWHLSNMTPVTWAEFIAAAAHLLQIESYGLETRSHHEMGWVAKRPAYSAITSVKGTLMPTLDNALERYRHAVQQDVNLHAVSSSFEKPVSLCT